MIFLYIMINVFYQCSTFFINFRVEDIYNTQLSAKAVSRNGVVFFGLVNNSALGCLNEYQPIQRQNIVSNLLSFFFFLAYFFQLLDLAFFFHMKNTWRYIIPVTIYLIETRITWFQQRLFFINRNNVFFNKILKSFSLQNYVYLNYISIK